MRTWQKSLMVMAALAMGSVACTDSPTSPLDVEFNATQTNADMQAAQDVFNSEGWQSFELLGELLGSAQPGAGLALEPADLADLAESTTLETEANLRALANRMLAAPQTEPTVSLTPIISQEVLGVTFVYNETEGRYVPDFERAGAPENGVRFIIYAVNPVTRMPIVETEVGHADFTDVGVELPNGIAVRLEVVSGDVTFLDYTLTLTEEANSIAVGITGFVTDGVHTLEFDLDITIAENSVVVEMLLEVPERSASVEALITFSAEQAVVEVEFTSPEHSIRVLASGDDNAFTAQIFIDNVLFATVEGSGDDDPVITGAGGRDLTEEEIQALRRVVDLMDEIFDLFEDLLEPVDGLLALGIAL